MKSGGNTDQIPAQVFLRSKKSLLRLTLAILVSLIAGFVVFRSFAAAPDAALNEDAIHQLNLEDLRRLSPSNVTISQDNRLVVNGSIKANGAFVLTPGEPPDTKERGTVYLDQNDNKLYYYDGEKFVDIATGQPIDRLGTNITVPNEAGILCLRGSPDCGFATQAQLASQPPPGLQVTLDTPTSGNILVADGTQWVSLGVSGDASLGANGNLTVAGGAINSFKILDGSITGPDIAVATIGNDRLQNNSIVVTPGTGLSGGGAVSLGGSVSLDSTLGIAIDTGEITDGTITFADLGQNGCANGEIIKWNGSAWSCSADAGGSGAGIASLNGLNAASQTFADDTNVTISSAGTVHSLGWSGQLSVARGGTGVSTFASNGVLFGSGAAAIQSTAAGTPGQLLVANGSNVPTFASLSGDATLAANGALTIAGNAINSAKIADGEVGTNDIADSSVTNAKLQNSGLTVTAGTGLTGGGAVSLGSNVTLNSALGTTVDSSEIVNGTIVFADIAQNGCANNEIIKWNGSAWACGADGGDGVGITSLNGLSGTSQTFTNDANVTISSSGTAHAIVWSGQLSVARGGTGANSAAGARSNLGAAASGANSDITSLSGLTTALSIAQGGTGQGSAQAAINALAGLTTNGDLLYHNGTNSTRLARGSNGQCLVSTAATIQWTSCSGAGSGNTLQAAYDAGNTVATSDARSIAFTLANTATDGNFSVNIATGSSGIFAVQDNGANVLSVSTSGATVAAGKTLTVNGDAFSDLTGTGLSIAGGTLNVVLGTTIDSSEIVDATITGTDIANTTISAGNIANATITALQIANTTITASQIANATITGTQLANDAVALSTQTTGNYVASISNGNGISGSGSSEGAAVSIALGALTANWNQTGAFNIDLNNSSSTIRILENGASPTLFGQFDIADLTGGRTYTFPDADGTVCLTSGNCLGGGAGGANTALSNLNTVAINTSLLPNAAGTINLGSSTLPFGSLYISGASATPGTNNFTLTGTATTGRTVTFPDATGTVCLSTGNCIGGGAGGAAANNAQYLTLALTSDLTAERVLTAGTNINVLDAGANNTLTVSVTNTPSFSGLANFNGGLTIEVGDTFTFNGDAFTDLTGTGLAISSNALTTTLGTSVDSAEIADGTITGTDIAATTIAAGNIVNGTITGTQLANDAVALSTQTTGNYVASISNGNGISGSGSSEGAAVSLALGTLTATWNQTGAFNIDLNNSSSTIRILENGASPTHFGAFDIADLTGGRTYTFPDADGTVCLTSGNCLGGGGGGANSALSNLASVAINTALLPGTAGAINLGSATLPFGNVYVSGSSATPGTNNFTITGVATNGRTITLPDATGTVCLDTGNCVGGGAGGSAPNDAQYLTLALNGSLTSERVLTAGTNISVTDAGANNTLTVNVANAPTFSGLLTANGGLTVEAGDTFTFNGDAFTDLSGTGLSVSSGVLSTTLGTSVDLNSAEVTGTLPIGNGGTGQTTSQAAINALSQLTTNGDLLYHNGTNSTRLARGGNGDCLTSNATTLVWSSCTGLGSNNSGFTDGGALVSLQDDSDEVTIGSTNTLGKLGIEGDTAGQIQLVVQGANGQSTDIFVVELDGGANVFAIGSTGNIIAAGDLAVNGDDITSDGDLTVTPAGGDTNIVGNLDVSGSVVAGVSNVFTAGTAGIDYFGDSSSALRVGFQSGIPLFGVDTDTGNGTNANVYLNSSTADGGATTKSSSILVMQGSYFSGSAGYNDFSLQTVINGTTANDYYLAVTNTGNSEVVTISRTGLITTYGGLTVEAGDTFTFNGDAFTDLSGTGLSVSSGVLSTTLGTSVDLNSAEVTSTLPIGNGGTGQTTSQAAINALSQLTTNGDLLYHNGTNSTRLARGNNNECLTSNATTLVWAACSGLGSNTSGFTDTGTRVELQTNTDEVTIGSSSVLGKLGVEGDDAAQIQLVVQGANGQSADIFVVEADGGSNLFVIDNAGNATVSGTINSQTISSSANFTGTLAVATHVQSPLFNATGGVTFTSGGTGSLLAQSAVTNAVSTNSGVVTLKSGDALGATSNSGGVVVDAGTATGTAGTLALGTGYASTVTVGRAGGVTSILGNSSSVFELNGVNISATEFNRLDGKDAALVDADDAVNTAITGVGTIGTGVWQGTAIAVLYGGTGATTSQGAINNISQLTTNGDLLYHNGTNSTRLARGNNNECLTSNATTLVWAACSGLGSNTSGFTDGGTVVSLQTSTDDVVIGGSTAYGKLTIDGDADERQLVVKAHSTQTTPLIVGYTDTNTELFRLSTRSIDSIFLGYLAGQSDDGTANYNTGIGGNSLDAVTSGTYNTAVGNGTLGAVTTTSYNSAFGSQALTATTGSYNSAFGQDAFAANVTGSYNTGLGQGAMRTSSAGGFNTALGTQAGYGNGFGDTDVQNNVFVGYRAGYVNEGNNNVLIGYQAGDNITTGSSNILLGYNIDAPTATGSNQLNIGNIIYGANIDGTGTTASTGNLTIGSSTDLSAQLAVDGKADRTQLLVQGHSSQAANLVVFETELGVDVFTVSNAGDTTVGGGLTATGVLTANGNVVLGNASTDTLSVSATITSSSLVFEGSTADVHETTLQVVDPTADVTYQFAAAAAGTYTICTSVGNCAATGTAGGDLSGSYPNPTVAKINGVDLGSTTATGGNLLIGQGTNWVSTAMSGDAVIDNSGVVTIQSGAVALGTDTSGNYVASITAGSGISGGGAGVGTTPTISLGALTSNWNQTGAFSIDLNNSSSSLRILENGASPTFFGSFDVADLTGGHTYTFPNATGTVLLSGSNVFSTSGDSGSSGIQSGDTLAINGGTNGIDTSLSGDTYTINFDATEVDTVTFGSGTDFTWTFNGGGASDPLLGVSSGTFNLTTAAASDLVNVLTGNLKVGNGTPTLALDGEDAYIEGSLEVDGAVNMANSLTQAGGAVSLGANAASSFTTSAGLLTLQGAGGVSIGTPSTTVSSGITLLTGNASAGTAGTIAIDNGTSSSGSGIINIGNSNQNHTIGIGNGGSSTIQNITIGSTGSSSGVTLQAGSGNIQFNAGTAMFTESASARTFTVQTRTAAGAGTGLTISAGTANGANAGGVLTLQGGNAGGSGNVNGGNLLLQGGARNGTGAPGSVVVTPASNAVDIFRVTTASDTTILSVDSSTRRVCVNCSSMAAALGVNGVNDDTQFRVRGAGAQTVDIFQVQNSSNANLLQVGNTGTVTVSNDFAVNGNTTLGNASSDTISFTGRVNSNIEPSADDTYSLGSASLRWSDLYVGASTVHIGTSATDEGTISYNTTSNILQFGTDATTNGDIAFFTDDLYLKKSSGFIGINNTNAPNRLTVNTPILGDANVDVMIAQTTGKRGLVVQGSQQYNADVFAVEDSYGNDLFFVMEAGYAGHKNTSDSVGAFVIQENNDRYVFAVDTTNERIGINVLGPGAALDVRTIGAADVALNVSNGTSTGAIAIFQDNGSAVFSIADGGNVSISGSTTTYTQRLCHSGANGATTNMTLGDCAAAGQADLAEMYETNGNLEPGDIVVPTGGYMVDKSSNSYQSSVIGIVSTNPVADGIIGNNVTSANRQPIALAGRVPVKVSLENGPIRAGDNLTAAATAGFAMKATAAGRIIGVALEDYTGAEPRVSAKVAAEETARTSAHAGTLPAYTSNPSSWPANAGKIMVFANAGHYAPTDSDTLLGDSLAVNGNGTIQGSLTIGSNLNVSGTSTLNNLVVTGTATITALSVTEDLTVGGSITVNGHIITGGVTPVAASGVAAGANAATTIIGNDTTGIITITTGAQTATGVLATVDFAKPFGKTPKVMLTAGNQAASEVNVFRAANTQGFTIEIAGVPAGNAALVFDYFVIE